MTRLFATTALVTALAVGPALAAEHQKTMQNEEAQATQSVDKPSAGMSKSIEFVATQQESDWLASSLIGRTVYNEQNEELGDINDVILGEDGQVVAVLIGVGGFLGIGEKDVGVKYSALHFQAEAQAEATQPEGAQQTGAMEPRPQTGEQGEQQMSASEPRSATGEASGETEQQLTLRDQTGKVQGTAEIEVQKQAAGEQPKEGESDLQKQAASEQPKAEDSMMAEGEQMAAEGEPMAEGDRQPMAAAEDADHSNIIIVLNTTREQLESAPSFAYLEDQASAQPQQPTGEQERSAQ